MYGFKDQKQVDKYTFVAMTGNLLNETRAGSDIDHIFGSHKKFVT